MAPLILEGDTLGRRHQHFNKLVEELANQISPQQLTQINYDDPDIDNLFKIDIACRKKDVDYILDVFKCEDMLYVSRAIKQSTWLITDNQYTHIINPEYLHSELFPQMLSKASNKLLLQIRLKLKDEKRVQLFYKYFEQNDLHSALKWLPHCSVQFIDNIMRKHILSETPSIINLFKRLLEKSDTIFEIIPKLPDSYAKEFLTRSKSLIKTNTHKYLTLLESFCIYDMPKLNSKYTHIVMKTCPERIFNKFEIYAHIINTPTFVKYIKSDEMKNFLLKQLQNNNIGHLFIYNTFKYFVSRIPIQDRFAFIKQIFIDRVGIKMEDNADKLPDETFEYCRKMKKGHRIIPVNEYQWYKNAPFTTAFNDLKHMIRAESKPIERKGMFEVLIYTAGNKTEHIHTLLQYYRDNHMNEPFKFKIQFVNALLSGSNSYRYDENTWNILNDIFCSINVFSVSENNVRFCIRSIIVYNTIRNKPVPDIIEEKFEFDTMKNYEKKLNAREKQRLFEYLFNLSMTKIKNKHISNETDLTEIITLIDNILDLLIDWKKDLSEYPSIISIIQKLNFMNQKNSLKQSLSSIYCKKKSWRKYLFDESLIMCPTEEVCLNILKHGPQLFETHKKIVIDLCTTDNISLNRLLPKLRIYYPESIGADLKTVYLSSLDRKTGHKAVIRGLFLLMPRSEVINIIKEYSPSDRKIIWTDNENLNVQKEIAQNMYLTRPQPEPDVIMWYAKGDYLQYTLPSLSAVFYNLCKARSKVPVLKILDAPVSLQKHGISIAFNKFKCEELKHVFFDKWKSSNNKSIRAAIFQKTHKLLCKENKPALIEEIWDLLCMFIDSLTSDENKVIYQTLSKVEMVPLQVRPKYCIKSYNFFKTLPPSANGDQYVKTVVLSIEEIIHLLDVDFKRDIFMESFDIKFSMGSYKMIELLAACLLSAKDEESASEIIHKIWKPISERILAMWNFKHKKRYLVRYNFEELFSSLLYMLRKVTKKVIIIPTSLFNGILDDLESSLNYVENYVLLKRWLLLVGFVNILNKHQVTIANINENKTLISEDEQDQMWDSLYLEMAPEFGQLCIQILKDDINKYFSSIYVLFGQALEIILRIFSNKLIHLNIYEQILKDKHCIEGHLLVIRLMPDYLPKEAYPKAIELCQAILSNASPEIKMHYQQRYAETFYEYFQDQNSE